MKKITFSLILYTLYSILYTAPTHAASTGLSISPPVTEVLIAPNKTTTTTLTLKNLGEDTHYQVSLHKVIPTDDLGHSTIDPTPLNLHQLPLIPKLIGQEFDTPYPLSSGQSTNLTLQLDAPSLDVPTDLYLALVIRALDPAASSALSSTTPAISALILTTITPIPAIPTDISLKDFALPTLHDSYLPLKVDITTQNNANIMLRVQGSATLTTPSGNILHDAKIEPSLVLGNSTRALPPLIYHLSPRNLGPHRLTIKLTTEGGRTLLESSSVVWILPIRAIILLIIGLFILLIIKIRLNRLTVVVKKD